MIFFFFWDSLSGDEYREVVGNLDDVVNVSEAMVLGVEGGSRMGRHLLGVAPQVKEALTKYCSHHPTAIATINRHKYAVVCLIYPGPFIAMCLDP